MWEERIGARGVATAHPGLADWNAMTSSRTPTSRAVWVSLGILALGLSLLVLLAQHTSVNTRLYTAAAEIGAFSTGSLVSEAALLSIVGLWSGCAVVLLLRRRVTPLARLAAGGIGSVLAYGASEVFKSIFAQVRPCHAVNVILQCPAPENWSYPSNHTVIAASLAVAMVFAVPKAGYLAVPLALAVGISRVVAGHHYPQDVLGGAVLGGAVAAACALLLAPLIRGLLEKILPTARPAAGPGTSING